MGVKLFILFSVLVVLAIGYIICSWAINKMFVSRKELDELKKKVDEKNKTGELK